MMAKPMKTLELRYPMIQFLIILHILVVDKCRVLFAMAIHGTLSVTTAYVFTGSNIYKGEKSA